VAQLVKCPALDFSSGHDLKSPEIKLHIGLLAGCGACLRFSSSLFLCSSPPCSIFLGKKKKKEGRRESEREGGRKEGKEEEREKEKGKERERTRERKKRKEKRKKKRKEFFVSMRV